MYEKEQNTAPISNHLKDQNSPAKQLFLPFSISTQYNNWLFTL
jgi:hypothetical protein